MTNPTLDALEEDDDFEEELRELQERERRIEMEKCWLEDQPPLLVEWE